jgi:hypothetical protein
MDIPLENDCESKGKDNYKGNYKDNYTGKDNDKDKDNNKDKDKDNDKDTTSAASRVDHDVSGHTGNTMSTVSGILKALYTDAAWWRKVPGRVSCEQRKTSSRICICATLSLVWARRSGRNCKPC